VVKNALNFTFTVSWSVCHLIAIPATAHVTTRSVGTDLLAVIGRITFINVYTVKQVQLSTLDIANLH